jgi:hypothetical protein
MTRSNSQTVQSFLSLTSLPGNGLRYCNCLPTRSRKGLGRPDPQFGRPLPIEAAPRITGALTAGVRVFSAAWVGHYVACEDMHRPSAFSSAGTVASGPQQYSCTALARSGFVIARSSRRRPMMEGANQEPSGHSDVNCSALISSICSAKRLR